MKQFWISAYDKFPNVVKIGGGCDDIKIIIKSIKAIVAAKDFLKQNNDIRMPKRSSDNNVHLCISEVIFENGTMYLAGKTIWYQ